jgi:predicted DCC family thiol-disulfide oxidoreductase YuxK
MTTAVAGVLIYDADCGFCQWSLAQGRRFLPVMPSTEPFQTADLDRFGLSRAQASAALQFVRSDGSVVAGHLAVAAVLMGQPRFGWRLLGSTITVPGISWATGLAYRWIARHRYLLPGATDDCAVTARST